MNLPGMSISVLTVGRVLSSCVVPNQCCRSVSTGIVTAIAGPASADVTFEGSGTSGACPFRRNFLFLVH